MTIKDFFSGLIAKFKSFFATKGGQVVSDALSSLFKELTVTALSILLDVAKNKAVQVEALGTITGTVKFDAVKQAVADAAVKEGIVLANHTLDTIVQLAAQSVK